MAYVSPEYLQELTQAVTTDVMNRGSDIALDRYNMPLLAKLWDKRVKNAGHANDKTRVNWTHADNRQKLQYWSGLDRIRSSQIYVDLYGEFDYKNITDGLDLIYTDLMAEGNTVIFDGEKGRAMVKKNSADDVNMLWNVYKRKVETFLDRYKVLLNRELYYTDDVAGIAGIASQISLDPTAGTIGGKSRASNPLLQHTVVTLGATVTAGGTLWSALTQSFRKANTNNRGVGGSTDLLLCGSEFLDAVVLWSQNNGLRFNTDINTTTGVDTGVKDEARKFLGVPFVWDPTLDQMQKDGIPDDGTPWTKRCYGICSAGLEIRTPPGMDMQVWNPPDPRDQRFTSVYADTRMTVVNTMPNRHFLLAVA